MNDANAIPPEHVTVFDYRPSRRFEERVRFDEVPAIEAILGPPRSEIP
jgi:hypothetical protein